MADRPSIEEVARGLTAEQRDRLLSADPDDISRFHYHQFKGRSMGLFQVAPGWQRMELSTLGLAVRAHLQEQDR